MNILKWAGFKRWLTEQYAHLLPSPDVVTGYREPFLGGGAVARHYLGRAPCYLSDLNADLTAMYQAVRDDPEAVIEELSALRYAEQTYYSVRMLFNAAREAPRALRAAWFLYLNRTCFNGLYRVNRRGEFNVPFGKYTNPTICNAEKIREASRLLQGVTLESMPFELALDAARAGEFVFLDPPYVPISKTANFVGYQANGFGPKEQQALAEWLPVLDRRGVRWMLTNADTPETRALYAGWNILTASVQRSVSAKSTSRGEVTELVVMNYQTMTSSVPIGAGPRHGISECSARDLARLERTV